MEGKNGTEKIDEVMLPGFRFHPTDEELVGFYLKKKIQQRPLPIELIKQVDIYKYDPWDLPNLACTGEKEWYFYCPRDRKYRNSTRPNRVTGAGFWKATGTDRPIYSSDGGTKSIGLKKSLVFYRGRAARGIKTDWMMHEFRLPPIPDNGPPKKFLDKNLPPHDAWAICRIFKKASSMAQRALSHSWPSPLPETTASDMFSQGSHSTMFSSENMSCMTGTGSVIQNEFQHNPTPSFSTHNIQPYTSSTNTTFHEPLYSGATNGHLYGGLVFSPSHVSGPTTKPTLDPTTSMLYNLSAALSTDPSKPTESIDFGDQQQQFSHFSSSPEDKHQFSNFSSSPEDMQGSVGTGEFDQGSTRNHSATEEDSNHWDNIQSIGFPYNFPSTLPNAWKTNLQWESPPCPSEISTTYSTN